MDTFRALADPTRRQIIEMLSARGQLTASDISEQFQISAPAISQHLKILLEAGLVQMEKKAQQRIYRVNQEAVSQVGQWVDQMTRLWNERFDALDRLLEAEKDKSINQEPKGDSA